MYAIMEVNIMYHFVIKAITQNVMIFNFLFVVVIKFLLLWEMFPPLRSYLSKQTTKCLQRRL